jgi:hypothetical protein
MLNGSRSMTSGSRRFLQIECPSLPYSFESIRCRFTWLRPVRNPPISSAGIT